MINQERLFKLRLVVARFGEMDIAGWWNTGGMLGRLGNTVMSRGFPKTDFLAQSKAVFEVARFRCREVYNPPRAVTLWDLQIETEDLFEAEWRKWCAAKKKWLPFFSGLQDIKHDDLLAVFIGMGLFGPEHQEPVRKMRRGPEGRSVPITGHVTEDDNLIDHLALGFCKCAKHDLMVPFAVGMGGGHR